MTRDFGLDQLDETFFGEINGLTPNGQSAYMGEMSATGVVPPGIPVGGNFNYNF